MKIRGVNLGNWLVLEKWMSQELFLGLEAEDESAFYEDLSSEEAKQFHPVIVGEWCIANKSEGIKELPEKEKAEAYRTIGRWEMDAWSVCDGWIFWSYKLHTEGRNDWDFQRAVDAGWLELKEETMK